jgi:fumarate reductase subunit D
MSVREMNSGGPAGGVPGSGGGVSLLALMRAEFTVSKRWRRLALALQLVAVGASIAATISLDPAVVWGLTLVALFALLLGYLAQLQAERARAIGEQIRRVVIPAEGLGWAIAPRLETDLRLAGDRWAKAMAARWPQLAQGYFASTAPLGPERLRDHLQESVFWHAQLSKRMATYTLAGVVAMMLVLLAGILLALNSLDQHDARSAFAKAIAALVPFLVTTNAVRLWWNFHTQATALEQLDAALDRTRGSPQAPSEIEVLRLLHEYDIQLLQAPEVPDAVYRWHRTELNTAWSARVASY